MALAVVLWLVSLFATPIVASRKGRSGFLWFILAFFFGPLALILVYFLSNRNTSQQTIVQVSQVVNNSSSSTPAATPSVSVELEKLQQLLERGALSETEFADAKATLLKRI